MIYFVIGIAGVIGALLRYEIGIVLPASSYHGFPLHTLCINLLGSFVLSWFSIWSFKKKEIPTWLRTGFTSGLIGSFTTFSTFSIELIQLTSKGAWFAAIIYFLISAIGGYGCSLIGIQLATRNEEIA